MQTTHETSLPRFLVISPAKTGSTWLADNLRCHPRLFVPAVKEVKYFSTFYKWLGIDWYRSHFAPQEGQFAGEASPSYAGLPIDRIQAIRELMPDVRLIFLLRDPVSRTWSHAKHLHHYREANFSQYTAPLEHVTDIEWRHAFSDEWLLASGDYLGQLRRWLSVFPREQIFVEFYESIAERPEELLREVFAFLDVKPDIDMSQFPIRDRILPGLEAELSPLLEIALRSLLGARTRELVTLLQEEFSLSPPPAWQRTLSGDAEARGPDVCTWSQADLTRIVAQEETFRTAYRQLHLDYRGYDLLFFRGRLLAVPLALSPVQALDGPRLEAFLANGSILTAPTLDDLKEIVTGHILNRQAEQLQRLAQDLQDLREESRVLRRDLQTLVEEVRRPPMPAWKRRLRGFGRRIVNRLPLRRGFVL